ncbi:hypothetical protein [Acidovorax sp. 69]|nr:hypothetical protein [Acidovorax sp. 69]
MKKPSPFGEFSAMELGIPTAWVELMQLQDFPWWWHIAFAGAVAMGSVH